MVALQPTTISTGYIPRRSAENIFHAVRFAEYQQRPLNTFITVNLGDLGIPAEIASKEFAQIRGATRRRWNRHRDKYDPSLGKFDFVVAHENPGGDCPHAHWMAHVPKKYQTRFAAALEASLKRFIDVDDLGTALVIKPIETPGTLAKYILKGVDPYYAEYFYMDQATDQGPVLGRRVATSRSLAKSARLKAGWVRKRRRSKSA